MKKAKSYPCTLCKVYLQNIGYNSLKHMYDIDRDLEPC